MVEEGQGKTDRFPPHEQGMMQLALLNLRVLPCVSPSRPPPSPDPALPPPPPPLRSWVS